MLKIDPAGLAFGAARHLFGFRPVLRADDQIDIAVRPQTCRRIEPGNRPAFYENGLNLAGSEEGEEALNLEFRPCGAEGLETVCLAQVFARPRPAQRRLAQAPPDQAARPRS